MGNANPSSSEHVKWYHTPQLEESIVGAPIVSGSSGLETDAAVADYTALWSTAAIEGSGDNPGGLNGVSARLLRMFQRREATEADSSAQLQDVASRSKVCTISPKSPGFRDSPYVRRSRVGSDESDSPREITDWPWDDIENGTLEQGSRYIFERRRQWGLVEESPEAKYEDIVRGS